MYQHSVGNVTSGSMSQSYKARLHEDKLPCEGQPPSVRGGWPSTMKGHLQVQMTAF